MFVGGGGGGGRRGAGVISFVTVLFGFVCLGFFSCEFSDYYLS